MKKIISILLTITMLFGITATIPLNVSAATIDKIESGNKYTNEYGEWTYELTDNGDAYKITGYNESMNDIEIPSVIDGIPVVEIGDYAFKWSGLANITIPDSVTTIGDSAFENCRNLTSIEVSSNNNYYSSVDGVLFNKTQSELICYPAGKLSDNYVIPNSVTTIGDYAFRYCDSLTSITIPDSVTTIGNFVFSDCYRLTSITIPDSVTTIGDYAFRNCNSLTSITIPDSVTTIGNFVFSDCYSLTSITIPDSVTTIGDSAFGYCHDLTNITIPNSVTTIGDSAFSWSSLTNITIPDSVTTIGDYAFQGCDNLTSIEVSSNNNYYSSVDGVLFNKTQSELICYPAGKISDDYVIPDSVTTIENYAFHYCGSLTNITIPDSVTTIGDSAFSWSSLTNITISDSVTTIGDSTFEYCHDLTNITIPGSVTTIGNYTFQGCYSLTNLTIPDSVTTIGNSAFYNCDSLTNVTIPDSVITIGDYAFQDCYSLTNITIPDSVTTIGNSVFEYCESLTSIVIPKSVTTIGDSAFWMCTNLTDVYYTGSEEEWNSILIIDEYTNACLTSATIHYNYLESTPGDISGDSTISVEDVIYLLKYIVNDMELTDEQIANADLNNDGELNVIDAIIIQRMILNG